jgi:hypothetical protein
MGFSRRQLVVVSSLFGGNPFVHGIFQATTYCCLRPFSSRWNFVYDEAFLTNFLFFTVEFWLSRSLSHELSFSRWNSGYHEAFLTNFISFSTMEFWLSWSLSHELSFFTMEFWLSWSLSHELSFFTMEFWLSRSLSHELSFSRWNSRNTRFGGRLFSYIYITKSIYIGSASLKTLALDLEPPLQVKEYGPSYSNATRKSKTNFFSRNHLYTRDSDFLVF